MSAAVRFLALLLCLLTVSSSQLGEPAVQELNEFYIEKLGMTLPVPEYAHVTGRTVSQDFSPLGHFGMTAAELEVQLKKGNIYCVALWFPEDNDMTEIIVTMTEDDASNAIFQLRDYDDPYLDSLAGSYANYSELGLSVSAMYMDASVVKTEQAAYIKAHGVMLSDDAAENHLHYMTVVNGQRIEITLVEHYTLTEGSEKPLTVSAANEQLMDNIIDQLRFDSINNEFVAKNRSFVTTSVIIGVLSAGLVIAYFVSKLRVALAAREINAKAQSGADHEVQLSDVRSPYKQAEDEDMDIWFERYCLDPDKTKEIDGEVFSKIICVSSLCIRAERMLSVVFVPAAELKIDDVLIDENGLEFTVRSVEMMSFTRAVPEWYLNTIPAIIVGEDYNIGAYLRVKQQKPAI